MNRIRQVFGRHADIALVVLVVGILLVLFAPVPKALLDLLLLANCSFALLLLLLTFYMARPVEFSTFPSLLLIATLFRLALNVAATRLILSEADAGRVIAAIGSYVVGGNLVIGMVVFLILVVVQYVVVTNGAQRVSEVAARFTLDSMPGQQMSIDADLNMGFIDQVEAQRRRRNIEKEAAFYGAMDGASKFVKGDAVAGIVILFINLVGGLMIGVLQHGMPWGQAVTTYSLLTIGDGIVTQVPALVIAVGTGIIVTRSASDANLSSEVLRQLTAFRKPIYMVAVALLIVALLPGIPAWPALVVLGTLLLLTMAHPAAGGADAADAPARSGDDAATPEPEVQAVEPLEILIGSDVMGQPGWTQPALLERVAALRRHYAHDLGLVLPRLHIRGGTLAAPGRYEIHLDGVPVGKGEARVDEWLAIHPTGDVRSIAGEATRDPTYGLPALWIAPAQKEAAQAARFTLVDGASVLLTHLSEVIRREAPNLITRAETERLLGQVRERVPGLVEELVPALLSVADVQRVLQNLLRENVSIRNTVAILETLADAGRSQKDLGVLTERVRCRLGRAICQALVGEGDSLHVVTMDPLVEGQFLQGVRSEEGGFGLSLDPQLIEQFLVRMAHQAEQMMRGGRHPVLLCSPELRRHIRALCERVMPQLRVVSMAEVPRHLELKTVGLVKL